MTAISSGCFQSQSSTQSPQLRPARLQPRSARSTIAKNQSIVPNSGSSATVRLYAQVRFVLYGTFESCRLAFECLEIFPRDLVFIQDLDRDRPRNESREVENSNRRDEAEFFPTLSSLAELAPDSFAGRLFLCDRHPSSPAASRSRLKHCF